MFSITAWNTRTSDAEITRLTEALRAAEEQVKGLREDLADTKAEYHRVSEAFLVHTRAALKGPSHET